MVKRIIIILFGTLLIMQTIKTSAQNTHFNPSRQLSQYVLDNFTTEDGIPTNSLLYIHQTKDSYLWILTYSGLIRFDGLKFSIFNKTSSKAFPESLFETFCEDLDSTFWINIQGKGLVFYKNGKFTYNKENQSFKPFVRTLFVDKNNLIWIGTQDQGLWFYNRKKFEKIDSKLLDNILISDIKQSSDGTMWIATEGKGLFSLKNKTLENIPTKNGLPYAFIASILVDKENRIWVTGEQGISEFLPEKGTCIPIKSTIGLNVFKIIEDNGGNFWFVTLDGLFRIIKSEINNPKIENKNFLPIRYPHDIFFDYEGSLWISTYRNGLYRLKDGKFCSLSASSGLKGKAINTVCEIKPNVFMTGSDEGFIDIIENNIATEFITKLSKQSIRIRDIKIDSKQNIWIGTYSGLLKINANGSEEWLAPNNGFPESKIRLIYEDKKGNIWLGTRNKGLIKIINNKKFEIFDVSRGLSSNFIMSIEEMEDGTFLVGTSGGGLNIIKNDTVQEIFNQDNHLPNNIVFQTYTDQQQNTWIVVSAGFVRWNKSGFFVFNDTNGLPSASFFDIKEDKTGFFWISSSIGLIRLNKNELNNFAEGKTQKYVIEIFNKNDGMKENECTPTSKALITLSNQILFPTLDGLVFVSPENLPKNQYIPPIYITNFIVDNQSSENLNEQIEIPAGKKRFIIQFTVLSMLYPKGIKSMYYLEPFEKDWIELNNKREIEYTNLPPGKYIFHVKASNNDGIWNETGATMKFYIKPYFYQTVWFKLLLIIALILAFYIFFKMRIKTLGKRKEELEKLVIQRTAEIQKQKEALERSNELINDSIYYAKRIQNAILQRSEIIGEFLPEHFILFMPRDIVSGDFYFIRKINSNLLISVADCTGHGVPGAFMSVLAISLLNEIVRRNDNLKPNQILNELRKNIIEALQQTGKIGEPHDGIDIAFLVMDTNTKKIQFAGAYNPLILIKNNQLIEIHADRMPVGISNQKHEFTNHEIELASNDLIYMFTDGYHTQLGGEKRTKFRLSNFKKLLLETSNQNLLEQKNTLANKFNIWRKSNLQLDDVLILGLKIS